MANDYILYMNASYVVPLAVCPCTVCGLNGRFYGVRFIIILSNKLNNKRSSGIRALLGAVSKDLGHEDEIGSVYYNKSMEDQRPLNLQTAQLLSSDYSTE